MNFIIALISPVMIVDYQLDIPPNAGHDFSQSSCISSAHIYLVHQYSTDYHALRELILHQPRLLTVTWKNLVYYASRLWYHSIHTVSHKLVVSYIDSTNRHLTQYGSSVLKHIRMTENILFIHLFI